MEHVVPENAANLWMSYRETWNSLGEAASPPRLVTARILFRANLTRGQGGMKFSVSATPAPPAAVFAENSEIDVGLGSMMPRGYPGPAVEGVEGNPLRSWP